MESKRSFEDGLADPDVTEPLLCSPNLKLVLGQDYTGWEMYGKLYATGN